MFKELEKLNENINYARSNHEYRLKLHSLYSDFFALKRQGKPFAECADVFNVLPPPKNAAESEAKTDVLNSLAF